MQVRLCGSEEETVRLGLELGRLLPWPSTLLLEGPLGSGKTVLVRGLAQGLEVGDLSLVRSPSFTLINEYPARRGTVYHVDLYRLESERDFRSLGLEEILSEAAVVIVEWGDRMPSPPQEAVRVRIRIEPGAATRSFQMEGAPGL